MKQVSDILEKLRTFLLSQEFCNRYRMNNRHFSRKRILTFQIIFFFILNLPKRSIAIELINFSAFLGKCVSRAAISKARLKISPEAFIEANQVLVTEFYTDNEVKSFCGFIVVAIDGSLLELPLNSPHIAHKYGTATNQTDCKKPMGRTSSAYDVLNGVTLDAILAPYTAAERDLAIQHIEHLSSLNLPQRFLLLLDRGYPSIPLIGYLLLHGYHFAMRCNTRFIREVKDVFKAGKKDQIITFKAKRAGEGWSTLQNLVPGIDSKTRFSIRVIVVTLSTGEREILLTSMLEQLHYPYAMFKELYFKRWGIEVEYGFKKNTIEVENFSGISCTVVEQDFHAAILIGNTHALLVGEAEDKIRQQEVLEPKKYHYKVNKRVGLAILKNDLIEVLINPQVCLRGFCSRIQGIMMRHQIPKRPGRSSPRIRRHRSQKYHMSQR